MIRIFTGTFWSFAVASSQRVIWKPPSPTMAQTGLPVAMAAPIAAGNPNPTVPAPPLEIQWRCFVVRQNCAAHIWCWPTSVVMMQSRPPSLSSRSTTYCARRPPFLAYFSGYCLRQPAISLSQSAVSRGPTSGTSASMASRASAAMVTSGRTTLLNSATSMSI